MIFVFAAPRLITTDTLRDTALAQVEAATGYRVRVGGRVRVSVFPSLDLVASDVGIAQPGSGDAAEFAKARTLRFALTLRGLLRGKMQLTEVTLVEPVITLPLPDAPAQQAATGAPPEPEGTPAASGPEGTLQGLTLDKLHIRDGTVVLPGENGAPGKSVTGLTLDATLPHANGPIRFEGSGTYDGDRVEAAGSVGSFAHFLEGGPSPLRLAVRAPELLPDGANINGTVTYKQNVVSVSRFILRSGVHTLSGSAVYRDDNLAITGGQFDGTPFSATARLDKDTLTVDVETHSGEKPVRVTGAVNAFDRFLAGAPAPVTVSIGGAALPEGATVSGTAAYKDDTFTLTQFSATSGEDALTGTAIYKDDVLSLTDLTATIGPRTYTGHVTVEDDIATLDLTLTLEAGPARLTGTLAGVDGFIDGKPARLKLDVEAPEQLPAKASVESAVTYKDEIVTLTEFTALSGDYRLTGNGVYAAKTLTLDPLTAETGTARLTGTVTANLSGDIPNVAGTLTGTSTGKPEAAAPAPAQEVESVPSGNSGFAPALAVDPPADKTGEPPVSGNAPSSPAGKTGFESSVAGEQPAAPPAGETEPAAETKAKVKDAPVSPPDEDGPAPAPKAPASTAGGSGWSGEPIDFSSLREVNGTLTLTLNKFVYDDVKIDAATVTAKLSGGKLDVEVPDLRAYGGGGSATLAIDASGKLPAHRLTLSLANLNAYPFLADVIGLHSIEGKATVALNVAAGGASERAMVSSLNGTAAFEFTDGALRGLNVANMLRNLTTGILTGWQFSEEAKTAFSRLGASFTIANGQAQTDDLRLIGPLVSVGGAGTVDLPAERLKFRVNPFMLASVQGSGGKNNMLGFPVPIAVTGPWDRPSFYPDIVGVLENPVAAYQQLNKLGGGLIAMPANLLGIDTGEGGIVERGVALPGAITKGVVGGIGRVLGAKPKNEEAAAPPAGPQGAAPPGDAAAAQDPGALPDPAPASGEPNEPPPQPAAQPAPSAEAPAAGANTTPRPAPGAAKAKQRKDPPNQFMQNMFGN